MHLMAQLETGISPVPTLIANTELRFTGRQHSFRIWRQLCDNE